MDLTTANVSWHRDPKTGRVWPLKYYDLIDIRDAENIGEVDYVWRINRCQHLIPLAKQSFLLGDCGLRELVLKQMCGWVQSNPSRMGVNWTSSMEAAMRCISWVIALAYLSQEEDLPDPGVETVVESIILQMDYVRSHLSRYSSANNHLIVELTGLITSGILFGQTARGQAWIEYGVDELAHQIEKQIYPDGVGAEQSIHYHSLMLDCLLLVLVLARRHGKEVPKVIYQRAERMCEFIAGIMDKNGHVPNIGDSDDGYLVWLTNMDRVNNYRSQLATGATLFERSDFAVISRNFDEKSFWLLGRAGYERFHGLKAATRESHSLGFRDGGYYVLRSGQANCEKLLLFDCGPLGYPSTASHGHADALSIWLSVAGHQVLVDSGTYSYLSHPEWRRFFRSTRAHNTALVNGTGQSTMGGPYLWLKKATAWSEIWCSCSLFDYVVGSHDGFFRKHKVIHLRRILFLKPDYWLVEDCFNSSKNYSLQAFFHFAAGSVDLERSAEFYTCDFVHESGECALQIIVPSMVGMDAVILKGDESDMQGWISPKYGQKLPTSVLTVQAKAAGTYRLTYILVPHLQHRSHDVNVRIARYPRDSDSQKSGHTKVELDSDRYHDVIYVVNDPSSTLRLGELSIKAETAVLRGDNKRKTNLIGLIAPSFVGQIGKEKILSEEQEFLCMLAPSAVHIARSDQIRFAFHNSLESCRQSDAFVDYG